MRAAIVVGLAALALAGCQATKPDATVPSAPIDAKIAAVSQELAQHCALAATGLILVRTLAPGKPAVRKALDSAEATRARFCASPPADLNEAIKTMATVAADLIVIWRQNS